jgi:K+-sensing histidine kinase KdpD
MSGGIRFSHQSEMRHADAESLMIAAATELSSPLVLLRQIGFALAADNVTEDERHRLSQQLTLTSDRALRLTASLSMTAQSQVNLPLEPINPVSICQDVVHELTPLFTAYGQHISVCQRSRIPLTVANGQLLRQILLGFGDNALHYGSADHPIQILISGHSDRVRIGLRDHGPAVPVDLWQRLEEKILSRARAPLATRPQVSGVSLLASKRLAEMMGSAVGTIRHRDGATFYVDLRQSSQMSLL